MSTVVDRLFQELRSLISRINPQHSGPEAAKVGLTGLLLLDELEGSLTKLPKEARIIRGGDQIRLGFESLAMDFHISDWRHEAMFDDLSNWQSRVEAETGE